MRSYFTRIRGGDALKNRIGAAIEGSRLPHALLIDGPRGSGKRTLATEIAAALNCEHRTDGNYPLPCGECNTCRRIREGSYTDVKLLSLRDGRSTVGVAEVKDLRADMFLSATESEHKVYIISDAERLTVEAQNALLIVLEEPPRGVHILLLCSGADKILTTIKSRAQYLPTPRLTDDELKDGLTELSPEAARLARADSALLTEIVRAADGCLGSALGMLDPARTQELRARRECVNGLLSAAAKAARYSELYDAVNALPTKRQELYELLEAVVDALRDMIAVRQDGDVRLRHFTSAEDAEAMANRIGARRLIPLYELVLSVMADNQKNANISALLSSFAARVRAL